MFKKKNEFNIWLSFSDLVIGCLAVFMLSTVILLKESHIKEVSVDVGSDHLSYKGEKLLKDKKTYSYMRFENDSLLNIDDLVEVVFSNKVLVKVSALKLREYYGFKNRDSIGVVSRVLSKLKSTFEYRFKDQDGVHIIDEGVIRFHSGSNTLFKTDEENPTKYFSKQLLDNINVFWNEIDSLSNNPRIEIKEIRIEGHTDSFADDDYNLILSQKRAFKVWQLIRDKTLSKRDLSLRNYVKDRIVTVGFGENKLIDSDGVYVKNNHTSESAEMSRRVEFRIIIGEVK